jgi:glycosyltransferase involved in cell wall biosynthesis
MVHPLVFQMKPIAMNHQNDHPEQSPWGARPPEGKRSWKDPALISEIREIVRRRLPPRTTILMIGEGHAELLEMDGRRVWHFPQTAGGGYAGYPASNEEAIAHLEAQRARGAEFLVVPQPAYWWLLHYGEFRVHLEQHYRLVLRDVFVEGGGACQIYALHSFRRGELAPRPFGVNVVGSIASEKGVGEAARATIRCLEAVRIPYVLHNYLEAGSANLDDTFTGFTEENPYAFNFINLNADTVADFVCHKGEPFLQGHVNIGLWVWELSTFPRAWEAGFQYFDEIWVPTNFVLDAVSRVSRIPVLRIPYALPEEVPVKAVHRAHFNLSPRTFVFLFVFDFHSFLERKNPLGLVRAFRKAFRNDDDVLLLLKGAHPSPGDVEALEEAADGSPVRVFSDLLSREEVNSLIKLSDCYVSLHRSEGFGLTLAEAMSLQKPVIATGYSGNTDFMTLSNSFLVNYALKEIERDLGPYPKGAVWAEPDLDHAAELMRFVYEHRDVAEEIGRRARQDILRQLHPQVVGQLMKDRLEKIAARENIRVDAAAV